MVAGGTGSRIHPVVPGRQKIYWPSQQGDDPAAASRRQTQYYEMLGHRAIYHDGWKAVTMHKPGTPFEQQVRSGYMTEEYVIETARKAGFRLLEKSEVNANPLDTADHPGGVWNLPPNLRNVHDADIDKMRAIGESDRMTLMFVVD